MPNTGTTLGQLRQALDHLAMADFGRALTAIEGLPPEAKSLGAAVRAYATKQPNDGDGDTAFGACVRGWEAYYQARYEDAGDAFARAWRMGGPWEAWAALGAGKVCSDLGRWDEARRWLIAALGLARRQDDFYRLAEAYGALGEVFVRAGRPRAGYECFVLDAALLPAGSGHAARLANYQAFCLSRLGRPDLAEPVLWASYYSHRESQSVSASFALASLAAMSVRLNDFDRYQRLQAIAPPPFTVVDQELPHAILAVTASFWAARQGDVSQAVVHLDEAHALLESRYPIERMWVESLRDALTGRAPNVSDLPGHQARRAPLFEALRGCRTSVLDAHLEAVPLPEQGRPFAWLETDRGDQLWQRIDAFFI